MTTSRRWRRGLGVALLIAAAPASACAILPLPWNLLMVAGFIMISMGVRLLVVDPERGLPKLGQSIATFVAAGITAGVVLPILMLFLAAFGVPEYFVFTVAILVAIGMAIAVAWGIRRVMDGRGAPAAPRNAATSEPSE